MADDVDKQFEELMKYKKVDLAQMIILQRISVDSLNEIINKMKCCENCDYWHKHWFCNCDEECNNYDKWKMKSN